MSFDARYVRKLAEHLDGLRGETVYHVINEGDKLVPVAEQDLVEKTSLFRVQTPYYKGTSMTPPKEVTATVGETTKTVYPSTTEAVDSLFWTQSAIHKFLLPYYVNVLPPEKYERLKDLSADSTVYAIGHRYPTEYDDTPWEGDGDMSPFDVGAVKAQIHPEMKNVMVLKKMKGRGLVFMSWDQIVMIEEGAPVERAPSKRKASGARKTKRR